MMTKKRFLLLFSAFFLSLFMLFLSERMIGEAEITSFNIKGLPDTWNIEREMLSILGRNKNLLSKRKLERTIEGLPYVDSADIIINSNGMELSGERVKDAVIIYDGSNYYFYTGELEILDRRDVYDIVDDYILLVVDSSFLISTGTGEKMMMNTLKGLETSNRLITRAEYDNNNSSAFSGSLTLSLDSVSAVLVVEDIREIDRLEEALKIIENEYLESKERFGEKNEYLLSSGSLIKMR